MRVVIGYYLTNNNYLQYPHNRQLSLYQFLLQLFLKLLLLLQIHHQNSEHQ